MLIEADGAGIGFVARGKGAMVVLGARLGGWSMFNGDRC